METERRVENICGTEEGSGVHVKKWTYTVEEDTMCAPHENKALVGKDVKQQSQIGTGADSDYMAFSAAPGVAQTNETLIQLDAAAQLDIFLDGLEESLAGSGVALQASSAEATGSEGEGAVGWFAAVQNQRLTEPSVAARTAVADADVEVALKSRIFTFIFLPRTLTSRAYRCLFGQYLPC